MPELPEVETTRRGIDPVFTGQRIAQVIVRRHDLRVAIPPSFSAILSNNTVQSTHRRGKYMIVCMRDGAAFIWHLGMSGRASIHGAGQGYTPEKHDHVIFEMETGPRIVFNDPRRFGMMYLSTQDSWQTEKPFSAMGPEPLGNGFNGPVLAARLTGKRVNIKNALLDQRVVAGVGNIYACEALYEAAINPLRAAGDLSAAEADNLAAAIRGVLERAIAAGGSSLKDFKQTDGQLGYFQHSFSVYDREGQVCSGCACGGREEPCIKRIVQSGRSTFYCPVKQR